MKAVTELEKSTTQVLRKYYTGLGIVGLASPQEVRRKQEECPGTFLAANQLPE